MPEDPTDAALSEVAALAAALRAQLEGVLYGQEALVQGLVSAVLAGGHVLLQGPPGVGKTLAARSLAALLGGGFARVQCVPDLLPADITGSAVYVHATASFEVRRGPLFADVVLVDELNRASPRTQSALLEAMAEGQVTIDGQSLALPRPHLVVATQNPWDTEGTYPLPLSERDRFLFELPVGYPPAEREKALLLASAGPVGLQALPALRPVCAEGRPAWLRVQATVATAVRAGPELVDYAYRLVAVTRGHPELEVGISPRGALLLLQAARAGAALAGRPYVTPEDVQAVWLPVCRHRLRPVPELLLDGFDPDALLGRIAQEVEVPR